MRARWGALLAAAAARPDRLKLPSALPPSVPLVGGRISCTTCHDGASPRPRRIVASRELCLACHRL